jgi:hypothetical protein
MVELDIESILGRTAHSVWNYALLFPRAKKEKQLIDFQN